MAISSALRRAASSLVPLASTLVCSPQKFNRIAPAPFSAAAAAAVNRAPKIGQTGLVPFASRGFSSSSSVAVNRPGSDENLVRVIESEIGCAEESVESQIKEVPRGFPFEIEDNPGQQTIHLKREYQGETINIEVDSSSLISDEEEEDDDDDTEKADQSSVPMVVRVSKEGVPTLEFGVRALLDEIIIESLSVKDPDASDDQLAYEGPNFEDLDENLQKGFQKYLEIRGIKPSATNFLHNYMLQKEHREYTNWLKNLKKFVEA